PQLRRLRHHQSGRDVPEDHRQRRPAHHRLHPDARAYGGCRRGRSGRRRPGRRGRLIMRTSPKAYIHRKPAWSLTVDGQVIDDTVNPRLISIALTEKRGADADELEISLTDHDGELQNPRRGAEIAHSIGWLDL